MKRWITITAGVTAAGLIPQILIGSATAAAIVSVACVCLFLWLSELTPPFVPTLLLWALIPTVLPSLGMKYSLSTVLSWAADPVLALFFGGFVLGVATERNGLDRRLAAWALRNAPGVSRVLITSMLLTAFMSMWMSNIAAASLVFACLRPLFGSLAESDPVRRSLLVGVAFGANLGGMATPIGTGPNAIAIASLAGEQRVTFIDWMIFAVPLTTGMLLLGFLLLRLRLNGDSNNEKAAFQRMRESISQNDTHPRRAGRSQKSLLILIVAAVFMWLAEPLHGIPAAVVALSVAALIFALGLLKKEDIRSVDWSTLLLIAGGITLGRLLEASGIVTDAAAQIPFDSLHPTLTLFIVCFVSAILSALMSNTATAVLLIPLASALIPQPSTAILVAVSASFGMPFVISTPPNAMAYGEGGLRMSDLFVPGLIIMLVGCVVVSLTGRPVLNFAGIP